MVKEKQKILLVYPKLGDAVVEVPNLPLSLLCVGSYLDERGYEVVILDAHNWSGEEFDRRFRSHLKGSFCVGFSVKTAQVPHALVLSKIVKENFSAPVVWGGKHPSLFPEQTASNENVDYVVIGEGEETLFQLIKSLESQTPIEEVRGLAFRKDKKCYMTGERAPISMDALPFLNYHLVEDVKGRSLADLSEEKRNGLTLLTSRGCPYRCAFCINTALRERYRVRSVSLVMEELQRLHDAGVRKIHFLDECFFVSRERAKLIVEEMIKRNFHFKWFGTVRTNHFNENFIDMELLKKIKESGCVMLGIGAESGSQRMLDKIKKDITVENTIKSAEMLDKVKIPANYSFMIGLPGETREDIYATLKLILKITEAYPEIEIYGPQIYRPYPGSEMYDEIKEQINFPNSLEGWAENRLLFGERSNIPCEYPWLQVSENELKKLRFYGSNANGFIQQYKYRRSYRFFEKIIMHIVRWRIAHNFYKIPVDYLLYQGYYKISTYLKYRKRGIVK